MKKLMTSTIILLPLILLAILLVSGAIKALTTHIYVDRVEFVDDDTLVLVMDDEENPPDERLEVNVLPLKAENRGLIFTIDDESIATVDANGNVIAKYYGETYVNVMSAEDNLKKDRRRVLVTDDHVHKIEITAFPTDMYEDNTEQLAATIYPQEAKETRIKWTSSNPDILDISATGIVEARGAGEVTITATSVEREGVSDSVTITCHSAIDSITTDVRRVETALETAQFPDLKQSPLDADVTIAYTSDAPDIARVDENGLITFLKAGKVTITATATDFGNTTKSTSVEYISTLHYYRLPLFEKKAYTVDFDEYYSTGKPLEIPFATGFDPANTNQRVTDQKYSIPNVLTFDAAKEEFYFIGEMPDGTSDITVTVTAEVYDTETNELTEKEDAFTLTVQRKAQSISVGYKETKDAQTIVLSDKTLIFGTDSGATAPISVFPSNHTDKLSYALENAEGTATLNGGTLTFQKAGTVDVIVSCKYDNGETHAKSRIKVSYAPVSEREHTTGVEIKPAEDQEPVKQQVLLSMDENTKEEGVLYFAEPADSTVTYAVVDEQNAAVELHDENGVQHIVPKKGGFATITITVSPNASQPASISRFFAPRDGEPSGTTVYTLEIYVDKLVSAEDLSVLLNGKRATGALFGATGTSVSYQFDVDEKESAMAGKVLYVTYSGLSASVDGDENGKTVRGNISFPAEKQELEVTFGVKYSEKALGLGANGTLPTVKRTLTRNAESVSFSYRGTTVSGVTTTSATLTFTVRESSDQDKVYVKIGPDNHTDTPEYSLAEGNSGATITSQGVLTFTDRSKPCSVTVQLKLRGRDGAISRTETIVVNYAPRSQSDKVITLSENQKLLLAMGDVVKLDYVVPAGATVACTTESGVVNAEYKNYEWTVTPLKGGFDTVTVNVTGTVEATYTVDIYVDRPVTNSFTVEFDDTTVSAQYYSTTANSVPFKVSVACADGAMAGKQLYVKYGKTTLTGIAGETTFSGAIDFTDLATLDVTFGVQYAEDAKDYGKTGEIENVSAVRTLTRNADSIAFSYRGTIVGNAAAGSETVAAGEFTTTNKILTFSATNTAATNRVYVNILPATHTDTAKYSLTAGENNAQITEDGILTFTDETKACSVTVQLQLTGKDGKVSFTATVVVNYAPRNGAKVVTLSEDSQKLLLAMGDVVKIDYVVPAGATVACSATASKVVNVEKKDYEWTITPLKGGFDTVTVEVTGGNADATYTIDIYVDRPVANNYTVELNSTAVSARYYSTTADAVPFKVSVTCEEGAMAGKQLYVKYGDTTLTGTAGDTTFTGEINFKDLGELNVTFGVQYAEEAKAYSPAGKLPAAVTRTVARNATEIAFHHKNTQVDEVTTTSTTLTFKTIATTAAGEVYVEVLPANHTDTVKYSLVDGQDAATIGESSGELKFTKSDEACTVTVKIQLVGRDGQDSVSKEIQVKYSPRDAQDKEVELPDNNGTHLLLFMGASGTDKGRINYTKPEGAQIECTAQNGVVDVAEQDNVWTITPLKGGFDTVTFKVTGGDTNETYTINVYVNRPVTSDNFNITLQETALAENVYGTTATAISFEVNVTCLEGAMAGKKIYVKYGSETKRADTAGDATFKGTIDFPETSKNLTVTFGVEYDAESTAAYEPEKSGDVALSSTTRTLGRNAKSLTVTYGGVQTTKIVTKEATVDFSDNLVTVAPAAHTDALAYVYNGDAATATFTGSTLSFKKAGTVTLTLQTKRGNTVTLTKAITVTYEPVGGNQELTLKAEPQNIVMSLGKDALIYFTEPENATVSYTVKDSGTDIVTLERQNGIADTDTGIYHIVPKQGGFATVEVTVNGKQTYTVNVYVNAPVAKENIGVTFTDTTLADGVYGTTLENVAFTVTVTCEKDAMQGKQIYVEYGENSKTKLTGEPNSFTFTGTVPFPESLSSLPVNIGVEYAAGAGDYSLSGEIGGVVNPYTLGRNAKSITASYGGVADVAKIVTHESVIDFGANGVVTVAPKAHTDTLAYDYNGDAQTATFENNKLSFLKAGTVTLTLKTVRGGNATVTKTITVTYEPLESNTEITLNAETQNIVMVPNAQARIYFTEKANTTVEYAVTKGNGVITADGTSGVYHITAQTGGFATVTVTVSGAESKTYTVNIYVNASVARENISVEFEDTPVTDVYGTTLESVRFKVTVTCEKDAMQGKRLYVQYGESTLTGTAGDTVFTGEIPFSKELGVLPITFGVEYADEAQAYLLKGSLGSITRTLGRNAESITVTYADVVTEKIVTKEATIDLSENRIVTVAPANHTDTLSYELKDGGGIASITGAELTFTDNGTVTVIIKTVRNGVETECTKTVTVTYEALGDNVEIKLNATEQSLVLPLTTENQKEALIYYTVPKDATVSCTFAMRSGDNNVITAEFRNGADATSGVYHIVPQQGGFATVTVTVSGGANATYTIKIYVDAPVTEDDFTVKFKAGNPYNSSKEPNGAFAVYTEGQEFTTCNEQFSYQITVANNNGAMLGKQLCIEYTGKTPETIKEKTYSKVTYIMCDQPQTYYFTISVKYTDEAIACGAKGQDSLARTTRTAISTRGSLKTAPTVTYDGGELSKDGATDLSFENIGEEITFTVDKASFNPADFKLSGIQFNADDYVGFSLSDSTFTLTGKQSTEQARKYQLNIGGQVFDLNITVQSRVQEIQVTCKEDGTVIGDGQKYKTLLDSLTFSVKAARLDGEPVTNSELEYNDGSGWKPFDDVNRDGDVYTYTLSGLGADDGQVHGVEFRATDGSGRTFKLLVARTQLNDFSVEIRVLFSDGNTSPTVIGRIKSFADAEKLEYVLPAKMSGTFALYIVADDIYLGGFGSDEQFKNIIPVNLLDGAKDWGVQQTLIAVDKETLPHGNINLTVPSEMTGSASVELGGGDSCSFRRTIKFTVSDANIAWFEFPGFDGNNSADVYKGYQQVRVFAKQSDYGDGTLVDYYRVPVAAYETVADMKNKNPMTDLTSLTWKLTSYTDSAATQAVVVTQTGMQVSYQTKQTTTTYNIVKAEDGTVTLQTQDGTVVVNANGTYAEAQTHVPWVDTVSEAAEGYVRVYFGEFVGLSETDVQNDYFGNFDDEKEWSKPYQAGQKDTRGTTIVPSDGAFSFLRLEGGNGGSVNAHFNFNVLQDDTLVNVFNATGYYAHDSLVLHENLYGPDELAGNEALDKEAQTKGLYLNETDKTKLAKTKIFGNGYQINFQARNDTCSLTNGKENTGDGMTFGTFYNVTVKGCNPVTNILPKDVRMIYTLGGAYYSDIQYYSKMNPAGGKLCLKNTVLHCVANAAIQLWWGDKTASTQNVYFEDVVIAECLRGLSLEGSVPEQVGSLHIKGRFDVLNYTNAKGMQDRFGAINGGNMYSSNFTEEGIEDQKVPGLIDLARDLLEWFGKNGTTEKVNHRYYINMILTSLTPTTKIEVWDEKANHFSEDEALVAKYNLKPLSFSAGGFGVTAYTYDVSNTLDGGNGSFKDRDMNQLFTESRDIRLLCEYKTSIDTTLVKNTDHIKWHMNQVYRDVELAGEKEGHIENLKKTLVGVKWPDGSSAADAGVSAAIALHELLSETVIPSKRAY